MPWVLSQMGSSFSHVWLHGTSLLSCRTNPACRSILTNTATLAADEQGKLDVKAAGLGQNEVVKNQITFDNFNTEQEYFGILKSKAVQGGVELSESTFKIRERGARF